MPGERSFWKLNHKHQKGEEQMFSDLLKSKRLWVTLLTFVAHLLAKHHVILSDSVISDVADQVILVVGAAGVVVTKILDSRKAAAQLPPAPAQPQAQ
jgi:hypothetical protein